MPRRVIAKVEHHLGELFPRVAFIVTTLTGTNRAVVHFYKQRGTAEQWIKEGKEATHWTRLSCHRFRANEVRLLLGVIAYNLGNLLRTRRVHAGGDVIVGEVDPREDQHGPAPAPSSDTEEMDTGLPILRASEQVVPTLLQIPLQHKSVADNTFAVILVINAWACDGARTSRVCRGDALAVSPSIGSASRGASSHPWDWRTSGLRCVVGPFSGQQIAWTMKQPLRFGSTSLESVRRFDPPNALWQDRREMRGACIRAVPSRL